MAHGNPQLANAGNLGDVLKHAALLALADGVVRAARDEPIRYLETHAFCVEVPLPDAAAWTREVTRLKGAHPAYASYEAAEQRYVDTGRYRCSVGLAVDRLPAPRLVLAEKDAATREDLATGLTNEGAVPTALLEEHEALLSHAPALPPGPCLALVDPFHHPEQAWPSLLAGLRALHAPEAPGAVLAFHHAHVGRCGWPIAPPGLAARPFTLHHRPYHLAAWATPDIEADIARRLADLGWIRSPGETTR